MSKHTPNIEAIRVAEAVLKTALQALHQQGRSVVCCVADYTKTDEKEHQPRFFNYVALHDYPESNLTDAHVFVDVIRQITDETHQAMYGSPMRAAPKPDIAGPTVRDDSPPPQPPAIKRSPDAAEPGDADGNAAYRFIFNGTGRWYHSRRMPTNEFYKECREANPGVYRVDKSRGLDCLVLRGDTVNLAPTPNGDMLEFYSVDIPTGAAAPQVRQKNAAAPADGYHTDLR